jgi:uncharacterized protein with NRDE domain
MCLILFAHKVHPDFPLVLAANRDESYARPTQAASFWRDYPQIYAGRDLEMGGTWLGIARNGRIAAITNFRDANAEKNSQRTRGELVSNFLRGSQGPAEFANRVKRDGHNYNGFNLLLGDVDELYYVSNRNGGVTAVAPGVHGLSNSLLNTPWPKVTQGCEAVSKLMTAKTQDLIDGLFTILADRTTAADEQLPDTGVGLPRERTLSSAFIAASGYGTRSSSVVLVNNHGQVVFVERSFGERGKQATSVTGRFSLESAPASAAA